MRATFLRAALLVLSGYAPAGGQNVPRIRPSQHGIVAQQVGLADITVEYDRPVARGRTLFGPDGIVRERPWTPGANWATTIEFTTDVDVEGKAVEKGKYSLWTLPGADEWTIILSRAARAFHTRYPAGQDALRVNVKPEADAHMETLAFYFPIVARDSTVLRMHWGTTVVPIRIRVRE